MLVHHVLFALATAALLSAGLRVASLAASSGLERVVTAATFAASAAILEALLLGLVSLGGSAAALSAAAALTWLVVRLTVEPRGAGPAEALAAWWAALGPRERVVAGGVLGLFAAWTLWILRTPALGVDSLVYHLPEALDWIEGGQPGSIDTVFPLLPVGNYPLDGELLPAWGMAISSSFVPALLMAPAMLALLATSAWLGLRSLGVPRLVAGLATATLCSTPTLTIWQQYGAQTDLPALAWLVTAAALTAASRRNPHLAAPALVAAGLAIGTKSTALALTGLLVLALLYLHRSRLRPPSAVLALGAAGFVAVGAIWYLRNLVLHGSPLWPFVATPWGDPVPEGFLSKPLNVPFREVPGDTIDRVGSGYVRLLAGGIVVLVAGVLAWTLDRRREVVAASATAALSIALWTTGPLTGVTDDRSLDSIVLSSVRYLLPATAAALLALALAGRRPGAARAVVCTAMAAALVWNFLRDHSFGHPSFPSLLVPVAGLLAGAVLGLAASRVSLPSRVPAALAPIAVVAAGALLVPVASGFLSRHARAGLFDAGLAAWFAGQPAFRDRDDPIAVIPTHAAPFAGDRLQHELRLVPIEAGCEQLERARDEAWVVMRRDSVTGDYRARDCVLQERPAYEDATFRVYPPRGVGVAR
jgi:hypothetical protein